MKMESTAEAPASEPAPPPEPGLDGLSADDSAPEDGRRLGLGSSIGIGVGAIVGGGILALGGVAFAVSGPSAVLAFALNGVIAVLTALSFAEMSTAFPKSGGAYTFAKKVLGLRPAFAVGWILWLAYIVAAVLYALGFAEYGAAILTDLWTAASGQAPDWIGGRGLIHVLAVGAVAVYSLALVRDTAGGSLWASWAKVVVFVVLIAAGIAVLPTAPSGTVTRGLTPFFAGGLPGLVSAMGFTFIALQGFEVIAAVAGEVKAPRRTIPRGMLYSLLIALLIYVPLLLLTSTVGAAEGDSITAMSRAHPETVMAVAVRNYFGLPGYWLVMVAALLSMVSALQANLLAASRIALSMAKERTLPRVLAELHPRRGTPVMAVMTTALAVSAIVFMIPDLASAGAAASLIFLMSFGLAHLTAILARKRGGANIDGAFRTPAFPLVPLVGGLACGGLALFQAVAVPSAGVIVAIWLGLGVVLYYSLFRGRAEVVDALAEAHDPELARLRGHNPLVLVAVANPQSAAPLVALGNAMAPPFVGRVLLLSVVRRPERVGEDIPPALAAAQLILGKALTESIRSGHAPEALLTIANEPWDEIRRVARTRRCESIVLGLTNVAAKAPVDELEELVNDVGVDASILWAQPGFALREVERILVPVGGKGGQDELRARILGSLCRTARREVTFTIVMPEAASEDRRTEALASLRKIAAEEAPGQPRVELITGDDPVRAIAERAAQSDLLVLGLARRQGRRSFGQAGLAIVRASPCATLLISRK